MKSCRVEFAGAAVTLRHEEDAAVAAYLDSQISYSSFAGFAELLAGLLR